MMTLLGAVLMLGTTMPASAMPDAHGGGPQHMQRMADQLNLMQAQRQQFKQIHRHSRAKMMQLKDAEQDDVEALHALNPGSATYSKETKRLAHDLGQIREQKIIQHSRIRAKIYAILTPEQREKAKEMHGRHMTRHARPGAMHDRFQR